MNKAMVKCLAVIVNRDKGNLVGNICHQHHLYFAYACLGQGLADSELLNYLGIGEIEKELVFTFVPVDKLHAVQNAIAQAIHIDKPGSGILFTLPISGISSLLLKNILLDEIKETEPMENGNYALIAAIINKGYHENLMDTAKKAGAAGGTLLHARSLDSEESQSFMGLNVQAEKEVILILTSMDKKTAIMSAINQGYGLKTEACGHIIALPVENVLGCNC